MGGSLAGANFDLFIETIVLPGKDDQISQEGARE
jgi:hypothetical protein